MVLLFRTWIVRSGVSEYNINLCKSLDTSGECKNAAVCKNMDFTKDSGEKRNYGKYNARTTELAKTGFNIVFAGSKGKCGNSGRSNFNRSSKLILKCGKNLVSCKNV